MRKRLAGAVMLELAAQAIFLVVALAVVFAFGLPEKTHAPRELVALIVFFVTAVPAGYGLYVVARTLNKRR